MQNQIAGALAVLLCLTWTSGCASTVTSTDTSFREIVDHDFIRGQRLIVGTKRASDGADVTYCGTLSDVDQNSIVFDSPRIEARVTQTLGLPVIGKFFKNSGVGRDQLDGPVPVRKDKIVSVKIWDGE